jgi:uncharacterized protein (DUF433 family)
MSPARSKPAAHHDLRDRPSYPLAEAARYLKVPVATVRSWAFGRDYETTEGTKRFPAIITPASRQPPLLSFWNLIEAHVLRALRTEHGVPVRAVRKAVSIAEAEFGITRLLLSKKLLAGAGQVFLRRYGELIELTASGQLAMRRVLEAHLKRVEWDDRQFPMRPYPFPSADALTSDHPIAIDPLVAFGRPVIVRRGITTAVIAQRIDAGESEQDLAADYDLSLEDIEQAIVYEHAA